MSRWSDLSKAIGWERRTVPYPTADQVLLARTSHDTRSLLTWCRFLPSPASGAQEALMRLILDGLKEERARLDREEETVTT